MRKKLKITLGVLLIMVLTTSIAFAGSWYYRDFNGEGTLYYTSEFYNTGSPNLRIWVEPSSLSRTYTFELQRKLANGTWSTVNTKSGTIRARDILSDNWSYSNPGYSGDFRYKLTFSSYSYFDGTVRYYY